MSETPTKSNAVMGTTFSLPKILLTLPRDPVDTVQYFNLYAAMAGDFHDTIDSAASNVAEDGLCIAQLITGPDGQVKELSIVHVYEGKLNG